MNKTKQIDLNFFDAIVYINMDHRTDRKKSILKELGKLKVKTEKIHRIAGVKDKYNNGVRGCTMSHIAALNLSIENNWKNVLILEDDCIFAKTKEEVEKYLSSFFGVYKQKWDVFFLGGKIINYKDTKYCHIKRIIQSTLAHSYALNNHYFETLKDCLEKSLEEMKYDFFAYQSNPYCVDLAWRPLQEDGRWFVCKGLVTQQKSSYSDIENRVKNNKYYFD